MRDDYLGGKSVNNILLCTQLDVREFHNPYISRHWVRVCHDEVPKTCILVQSEYLYGHHPRICGIFASLLLIVEDFWWVCVLWSLPFPHSFGLRCLVPRLWLSSVICSSGCWGMEDVCAVQGWQASQTTLSKQFGVTIPSKLFNDFKKRLSRCNTASWRVHCRRCIGAYSHRNMPLWECTGYLTIADCDSQSTTFKELQIDN
jgi:hypothetical protein